MFQLLQGRIGHYAVLLTITLGLYLPGLGTPSLWDIDEGNNAQCAYEMLDSGNWIVPTFNHELRTDKPALLYWCQVAAYRQFGVSEFAARLPSALAALLTVLLTYELGRRLFDPTAALLGGLVLSSAVLFCGSAHFANPDALLNACSVLSFLFFWQGFRTNRSSWLAWVGVSTGVAFLAKGPVGLLLPLTVINGFLLWQRQVRRSLHPYALVGILLWVLVAVPWFALVGAETKGAFLKGFFLTHNVERYSAVMEGHGGPFFYHAISLLLGLLPWSVFLVPTVANAWREGRGDDDQSRQATRFLACWFAVYFVFFSCSQTKLPNYILPLYPAAALLVGRFLARWQSGTIVLRRGIMGTTIACWGLIGLGTTFGLLAASGVVRVPGLRHRFPGLEAAALLGVLPLLGAAGAWVCWRRGNRNAVLGWLGATAVLFVGAAFQGAAPILDAHKAPRPLVAVAELVQPERDIRIGCFDYFQPSLVFYCGRKVERLNDVRGVQEFLQCPLPAYLFVPMADWEDLAPLVPEPYRLLGRHWDLYRNCDVLVIGNGAN